MSMTPEELSQVEQMCTALYSGTSPEERSQAQKQLGGLQQSAEFIPQCQFILDNSSLNYAQVVAISSLEILITQFWNNFTLDQKLTIRNYVLNFLANKVGTVDDFVMGNLSKLTCRITKLGWFDSAEHRDIIEETSKFLQATINHHIVGLRLLIALVDEMNSPTIGRTLTVHRKTAVSFRDQCLFQAFQISITTLRHLQSGTIVDASEEQKLSIANYALGLSTSCLSFDFIGTNPEESAEDVGTVQVPSSWRPIVQDTSTMQLFFDYYRVSNPPRSNQALQAIVQLSSVRRSLFSSEKERTVFLQALMDGIQEIMRTELGLGFEENYHEFCRLLGRLKASYQLSELVKVSGFAEWLELASRFTITSLQNWQHSMNSIHYLLALWGRMVAALPYLRTDSDSQRESLILRESVLQVTQAYIETVLNSVEICCGDSEVDDPLDDEGSLKEQMDRLPVIARLEYERVAQHLLGLFENAMNMYEQALQQYNPHDQEFIQQVSILEGRMTWLTHMVSAVIGAQAPSDPRRTETELIVDGQLSRCVFKLVEVLMVQPARLAGDRLEKAILTYFKSFKKVYMTDNVSLSPSLVSPGASPAHPLLSLALSYPGSGSSMDQGKDSKEAITIFDAMKIGDLNFIMNMVVTKICNNIKYWHQDHEILEQTLEVFVELVSTYSSSKTLLQLEAVNFMVHNHVGAEFPFLGYNHDNKHRVTFYSALSRLVFSAAEDLDNSFDTFVQPNLDILVQLDNTQDLSTTDVKLALIGVLRDLRGICLATNNKRTFNLFFDAFFTVLFPLLVRVAEVWNGDPVVMTALLKFMQEFVQNKGQRVMFEQSSANGILLFRETSRIVCSYGSKILALPVVNDIYIEKYKGIRLMLNVLTCALSGNYVNFGVFALFDDHALQNALDVSLQMCLQIPMTDVLSYVKLSKAFYSFLEVLFRSHLDVLCQLDSAVFIQLVKMNHEGLQSADLAVSAHSASTIDHIATYMFLNQRKQKPTVVKIQQHIQSEPNLLNQLMNTLFNSLLFASNANNWAVTRPILSLMLANMDSFTQYQEYLIRTQTEENQVKLREEFKRLLTDVQKSTETTNRDRFTQKLTVFRLNVRQFLTL